MNNTKWLSRRRMLKGSGGALAALGVVATTGSDKLVSVHANHREALIYSTTTTSDIRPFRVRIPRAALADLDRRIAATRWPDKETVADASQGAPLTKLQELVQY